jgi:hypothetical protein
VVPRALATGVSNAFLRPLRDGWVGLSDDWKALLVAAAVVGLVQVGVTVPA